MKLAVRKERAEIPGSGFHYMLNPIKMENEFDFWFYERIGYVIIEVTEELGIKLLEEAARALRHQYHVAVLTEEALGAKS